MLCDLSVAVSLRLASIYSKKLRYRDKIRKSSFSTLLIDPLYILRLIAVNGVTRFLMIVKFPALIFCQEGRQRYVVKYLHIFRDLLGDLNDSQ